MKFMITVVRSTWDNTVVDSREHTWDEFINRFAHHVITKNKENTPMIVPCSFKTYKDDYTPATKTKREGGGIKYILINNKPVPMIKRGKDNVVTVTMLPLDFDPHGDDNDITVQQGKKRFDDYKHFGYTSFGHHTEKKFGKDAFRIFIPFSRPMTVEEYFLKGDAMLEWVGNGIDMCSTSISRGFYIPSYLEENKNNDHVIWHNDGKMLDPDMFIAKEPAPPPKPVVRTGVKHGTTKGKVLWNTLDVVDMFQAAGLYVGHESGIKHLVRCPWEANHSFESPGTAVFAGERAGFNCFHGGCSGKGMHAVKQKMIQENGIEWVKQFCEIDPDKKIMGMKQQLDELKRIQNDKKNNKKVR